MENSRRHLVGPSILVALALLMNIAAFLQPSSDIDLGPIDLTPGAEMKATFRAAYSERYAIGVKMDQKLASQLYPCVVSVEALQTPKCRNSVPSWPVNLALRLSSNGRDLSNEIETPIETRGGEYEGADFYTWAAAYINPVPGRSYRLYVRSKGRTSLLQAAHPHLIVTAAGAPGLLESIGLTKVAALIFGFLLAVSAAFWWLFSSYRRRRSLV